MENYDFSLLIYDIVLTVTLYMSVPSCIRMFSERGLDERKAKNIALFNSIIVCVIFFVLTMILSNGNSVTNFWPAFLYYGLNKHNLFSKSSKGNAIFILILSILCLVCSWFKFFIIFLPLGLILLTVFIVYVCINNEMKCSVCNNIVGEDDYFCQFCGVQLKEKASFGSEKDSILCPKCNSAVGQFDIFCQSCGNRLAKICLKCNSRVDVDDIYCLMCGFKLVDDNKDEKCIVPFKEISCNKCEAVVEPTDLFCHRCGNDLRVEEDVDVEEKDKICSECGLKVTKTEAVCPGCGNKFAPKRRQRKKNKKKETSND